MMKFGAVKHKRIICQTLALLVILSAFSVTTRFINAASTPVLSIVPTGNSGATAGTTTIIPAQAVSSTFSVDVRVDNYASVNIGGTNNGVSGASYTVNWDASVLGFISYSDGSWLPSQSNIGDSTASTSDGKLTIGQIAFGSSSESTADASSGSVSVTIKFQVLSAGSTSITLEPQGAGVPYLIAPETPQDGITAGYPVPGTLTANAQYGSSSATSNSPVYGPTASFTPSDGSTFKVGAPITLDATSSHPGNDSQVCNITGYAWSVECLNGTVFASLAGEIATFTPNSLGSLRIILIVTAPDVNSSPSPSYVNASSTSAIINVVSTVQSVSIKVFTGNGGSDVTYGPLQLVPTYALVTDGNGTMPDEGVIFTIEDANGSYYYRQGVTNESGIATIQPSFRLPSPNFGSHQTGFGKWSITASAKVLGVNINDTTFFNFNYVNGIENVTIPRSIQKGQALSIQLTIDNQDLSAQWTQLSITLFDQASIPIGSSTLTVSQQIQNITVVDTSITIPTWAFAGQATVYLCLFANSTNLPLSPEGIANFNILS